MERIRRWFGQGAVALVSVVFAFLLGEYLPFLVIVENWAADYRVASLTPAEPQHPDIVVVSITEDTLQLFPYRSPVDRHFLAGLLEDLDGAGVRAVGLDVLFDQPSEPAKDAELRAVLARMKAPVVASYIGADEGLNEDQREYLDEFLPQGQRGYASLHKDAYDQTVREMFSGRQSPDGFIPGFPLALAARINPGGTYFAQPMAWRGKAGPELAPFRHFPAHTVKLMPKDWLRGKIVLIGSDLSLTDRHRTPFYVGESGPNRLMPGVDIHAHALAQLLDGRRGDSLDVRMKLLLCAVIALAAVALSRLPFGVGVKAGLAGLLLVALWVGGFFAFARTGLNIPLLMPSLALASAMWLAETLGGRQERQQKQFIKNAFGLYMSPSIVDELVKDPSRLTLGGERREMTFLFTDVAGFTTVSEQTEPAVLGAMLNQYFDGVCSILMEQGGAVVDFIGDAVFCLFGAPVAHPDHAERAIICARRIEEFSRSFRELDHVRATGWGITRIGVHTGNALIGNFGSGKRFKYSAVGDAVNTGARIEGLNKYFGTAVCVSETSVAASGMAGLRPLGRFTLKGKSHPIAVFEPVSDEWLNSPAGQGYLAAYALMAEGQGGDALAAFQALEGDDPCIAFHLERLKSGETTDVVTMKDK
ncbi:Adenylate cyclase [Paramagnetospirillum magnetotacticum MS-1]|uniref:Adenylate cyclase n=1 Tax=Paramagnetospirillum magnetotacticum MS-1 TaxID=272627 RepID=A0A0C2UF85_PARME|nr:adenylate/guanylate cyclase domain-containing protein [Paramagnetospirillum magnetotacticum]KIM00158.1 Adenylate cyclase [Paramagnetospirillum magnetotacticum MS-1]